MLFQKEEKNISKGLCSFHPRVTTPNSTFAQTSLCPSIHASLCQDYILPSISQRMLAGRLHAREWASRWKVCLYLYLGWAVSLPIHP